MGVFIRMARHQARTSTKDTREKLMRLAARAFGTQGYSATTMRYIADQAGIEAASIYYHFSSKEELVDAVMEYGAESIVKHIYRCIESLPEDAGAEQHFKAALVGQLTALIEYGDYAIARGRLHAQLPQKVQEHQKIRREQHQDFWDGLLKKLRVEGCLRNDVNIALCRVFILSSINSALTWFNPAKGTPEAVIDELCSIFFEGVRSDNTDGVKKPQ